MRARRLFVASCVFLIANSAFAQSRDSFDLDDFIAPPERAVIDIDGNEILDPFVTSRFASGFVRDYRFRGFLTDGNLWFAKIYTSFYWNRLQASVDVSGYQAVPGDVVDTFRSEARLGFYFKPDPESIYDFLFGKRNTAEEDERDHRAAIPFDLWQRFQVSWNQRVTDGRVEDELSVDLDFVVGTPGSSRGAYANVGYIWNPLRSDQWWTFRYHAPILVSRWGRLFVKLGAGLEYLGDSGRKGELRFGAVYPGISIEIPLPVSDLTLHGGYTPAYRIHEGNWNHEVSIFLSINLYSKLWERSRAPRPRM